MKSIELQIALPRTNEAGRVQNEMQQRPQIDQDLLAAENMKSSELNRKRSTSVDESAQAHIQHDGERSSAHQDRQPRHKEREAEQGKEQMAEHPYKGKHIDFTL